MARASNTRLLSHIDCPGGGQVWVDRNIMYVSHMRPPEGTSIYDVSDPLHPKFLFRMDVPMGWHSHKVRAQDGIMIVNYENFYHIVLDCPLRRTAGHLLHRMVTIREYVQVCKAW